MGDYYNNRYYANLIYLKELTIEGIFKFSAIYRELWKLWSTRAVSLDVSIEKLTSINEKLINFDWLPFDGRLGFSFKFNFCSNHNYCPDQLHFISIKMVSRVYDPYNSSIQELTYLLFDREKSIIICILLCVYYILQSGEISIFLLVEK